MTCSKEKELLLHAMLDGELDAVNAVQFEEHLKACSDCSAEYERQRALRSALRRPEVAYRVPDALRERLTRTLDEAIPATPQRPRRRSLRTSWWVSGVSLALAASLALFVLFPQSSGSPIERQIIDSHVRSLLADHLTDIRSSDHHTVKPWFNGKVAVAPEATDLAQEGFPLAGGRLDYIDHRVVAAVVYRRGGHVINLFVWPSPDAKDAPPEARSYQGYNLLHWVDAGTTFWAVSDTSMADLKEFEAAYVADSKAAESSAAPNVAPSR
jgi:anti-sigma factor RsiW